MYCGGKDPGFWESMAGDKRQELLCFGAEVCCALDVVDDGTRRRLHNLLIDIDRWRRGLSSTSKEHSRTEVVGLRHHGFDKLFNLASSVVSFSEVQ